MDREPQNRSLRRIRGNRSIPRLWVVFRAEARAATKGQARDRGRVAELLADGEASP